MTINITHATWVNPSDKGYWDSWNPQWSKAIMDHLGVESEEQVAAIIYTEQHPDQIDSSDYMVSFKDRTVVPYEGFSVGTIRFGEVFINGQRVPCCTDIHGGGHPELLYIDMDVARSLTSPPIKEDPKTNLAVDFPGPGAEGIHVSHVAQILNVDLPLCGSVTQYTCPSPFGGEQVVTMLTLPNLECGMAVERNSILVRTQVKATPQQTRSFGTVAAEYDDRQFPPAPTPENPANTEWFNTDPNELPKPSDFLGTCDECGVDCPPTAHFGTPYGHYCAKCYRGQIGDFPDPEEMPVGNVQPTDHCPMCNLELKGEDILTKCPGCNIELAWSSQSGYDYYNSQDKLPVGNVRPEDLTTELFPGDEV